MHHQIIQPSSVATVAAKTVVRPRILPGLLLMLCAGPAWAAPTVLDASFENPVTTYFTGRPAGTPWTYTGGAGVSNNNGPFYATPAPDGQQAAFIQTNPTAFGSISQVITGLTVGTVYSVSFYEAMRAGFDPNPIDVTFGTADLGTYTPASLNFVKITTTSFRAVATSGTLTFAGVITGGADIDSALDLVSVFVPEPASLALFATTVLAVTLRRTRVRLPSPARPAAG